MPADTTPAAPGRHRARPDLRSEAETTLSGLRALGFRGRSSPGPSGAPAGPESPAGSVARSVAGRPAESPPEITGGTVFDGHAALSDLRIEDVPTPDAITAAGPGAEPPVMPRAEPPGHAPAPADGHAPGTGDPAHLPPLSRAWRAGLAAGVAVAAVIVAIVSVRLAAPAPSTSAAATGPTVIIQSPRASASAHTADIESPPPGLSALPLDSPSTPVAPTVPANAPSVTVLNQTATKGLGSKEADLIRAAGWTVRRVTNVHAIEPTTTVFYETSQEASARQLRQTVPSVRAMKVRPNWLLPTGGLIVIVAG